MKRHVSVGMEQLFDCVPAYVRERMKLAPWTEVRVLPQNATDILCNRLTCEFDVWPAHLDPYEGG